MAKTYAEIAAEAKTKDYATKAKVLKEMRTLVTEYHKADYKAQSDQWRTKFTELNKNAREGSKGAVKAITTLMNNKTDIAEADRRMLAAYARDLAARSSGRSFNGEQEWRRLITKSEPGADQTGAYSGRFVNPAEIRGRVAEDLGSLSAYPPDSPMRYYLMGRALGGGLFTDDEMHKIVGEEAWQKYLEHKDDQEYEGAGLAGIGDKIILGTITTPDLDKLKDEAVKAAKVKDADVPEFVYAPSAAETSMQGKVDALTEELADADLSGVPGDLDHDAPERWFGYTDAEAGRIISNPAFQRWAKAYGMTDLGSYRDGVFRPGADTKKAFRLGYHQEFKPTVRRWQDMNVLAESERPQRVVLTPDKDGVVSSLWLVNDDGSVDKMDLADGSVARARDISGRWLSQAERSAFAADAKADPPHPYGIKGQAGWTRDDLAAKGPIDLGAEDTITSDPSELKATRKDRVEGVRRMPSYGDDPDLDAVVEQPDGTVVRLRRDRTDQPWRIVSGEALHKDVGLPDEPTPKGEAKAEEPKPEAAAKSEPAKPNADVAALADELQKGGEAMVAEAKKDDEAAAKRQVREAAGLDALEASTKAEEERAARSFMARPMSDMGEPVVATQAPVTPGKAVVAPPYEEPVPVNSPALKQAEMDWEERHKPGAVKISDIVGRREVKDLGDELEAGGKALVEKARAEEAAKKEATLRREADDRRMVRDLSGELARGGTDEYWKVAGPRVTKEDQAALAADRKAIIDRREVADLGRELEAGGQAMVDTARAERADKPLFKGTGTVVVDAKPAKEEPFFKGPGTVTVEPTAEEEKAADALKFKGPGTVTPEGQVSDGSVTKEALRRLRQRAGG